MSYFWINGRFGWPIVISVIFIATSAFSLDFIWRVVTIPSSWLITFAFVIETVAAGCVAIGYHFIVRAREKRSLSAPQSQSYFTRKV